jgi:hypothetical protein
MEHLIACAPAVFPAVAGDTVADLMEVGEFLGVQVE